MSVNTTTLSINLREGHFRTARAQRQLLRCLSRGHPCKPPTYRSVHDQFKTASGVQNSGPWDPWLPVVERTRLFAQCRHSARCAPVHGSLTLPQEPCRITKQTKQTGSPVFKTNPTSGVRVPRAVELVQHSPVAHVSGCERGCALRRNSGPAVVVGSTGHRAVAGSGDKRAYLIRDLISIAVAWLGMATRWKSTREASPKVERVD